MISARVFICHDLDLADVTRLDTQIFQRLCERLRETGAEVVTYAGRASEEAFLPFVYQELSTCQWFLVFQTPEMILVPEIRTAVNAAQAHAQQKPMLGILRFLVHPDEAQELVPEWSAIPTVGASYDYLRAIEKLLLALSLNDEITTKDEPIAPPPPLPLPFASPQASPPLLLSAYDAQVYNAPTSTPLTNGSVPNQPAEVQPANNPYLYNSPIDRPPKPPTRLAQIKTAHPAMTRVLLVTPILAILLVLVLGMFSPLRALVVGSHNSQPVTSVQRTSIATTATPTSQATAGTLRPGITPTPTSTSASSTPGVVPTPQPTVPPTPTPKPVCPPTIQFGSTGSAVSMLQTELNNRGMKGADGKTLLVEGDFGSNTQFAVKSWQTKEHIQVDGVVGPITWHTLGNC